MSDITPQLWIKKYLVNIQQCMVSDGRASGCLSGHPNP